MKAFFTLLSIAAALPAILAQEEEDDDDDFGLPECALTCINKGIDVGEAQDCEGERDLTCLCANPDVGETIRSCAYSECTEQEDIDAIINYVFHVCEDEAGVTITVETGAPTETATAAPDATGTVDAPAPTPTEDSEPDESSPVTVNGGIANGVPALAGLVAACGFAVLLV